MRKISTVILLTLSIIGHANNLPNIKPAPLHRGDEVGLISSGFRASNIDITYAKQRLHALGLKVVLGDNIHKRAGYFAGTDLERAHDINTMFANPRIKAIFEIRGGWGSQRVLPLIDFDNIKKHPKIFVGFSDITSLLLAIHAKTGLITFHGPMGIEPWPAFTVDNLKQVLFEGKALTFKNPKPKIDKQVDNIKTDSYETHVVRSGTATGKLLGGNLTVLTALLSTQYQPDWKESILFVEDVGVSYYQIDRMLAQLQSAGVLKQIKGFVFGECTGCHKANADGYDLQQVLDEYIKPLHIPAYSGATFGHEPMNFTLPEGTKVKLNAGERTIKMLAPAVLSPASS
tara:strand:- start:111357 stop:112388 length:1032 start_codon:yes stop_codon:yes gene_type:complete